MTFKEHLRTFMNEREVESLLSSIDNTPIKALKLNELRLNDVSEVFKDKKFISLKHIEKAYQFNEEDQLGKDILFQTGAYYIQEPSSMLAVETLNIVENDKVLDMCAAPGGKSFQIINKLHDKGLLICNDIHTIRSKVLSANIEKSGAKNVIVLNDDSKNYKQYFVNFFDKILLDAPCSGSGMFRKDEFAKSDWSIEKVYACQKIQKELLSDAYSMLKPGGEMVYSTCSFSIQENEEVIKDFLLEHDDCKIVENQLCKAYSESIGINGCLRLYPFKYNGEGQFIAHIKKDCYGSYETVRNRTLKECRVEQEVKDFFKYFDLDFNTKKIVKLNNEYYYADFEPIDLIGVKVLRYGLHLGMHNKKRFIPNHSLAMYHKIDKKHYLSLSKDEALNYLKGYTISKEGNKGWCVASYNNLPLGFAKQVNDVVKNHLPKGLIIR